MYVIFARLYLQKKCMLIDYQTEFCTTLIFHFLIPITFKFETMPISYLSSRSNTRLHTFCSSLWPNQLFLQSNSALGSMSWDPISYRDSGLSIRLRINLNTRWKNHSQSRYTVIMFREKCYAFTKCFYLLDICWWYHNRCSNSTTWVETQPRFFNYISLDPIESHE